MSDSDRGALQQDSSAGQYAVNTVSQSPGWLPMHSPSSSEDSSSPLSKHPARSYDLSDTGYPDGLSAKAEVDVINIGRLPQSVNSPVSSKNSIEPRRPWRAKLIRFGPLSGISSMLFAVASLIASLGILAGSDHQATTRWSSPPSTYLAIFTAIANLSMRYAAIQGVIIAWWIRAMNGSTLAKLHWDWRSGTTLRGAVTAGKHMGLLGLACIFSTVVVIDGPLLQRSTTIVAASIDRELELNISMVPEMPRAFNGVWKRQLLGYDSGFNWGFNRTVPTNNGSASNDIYVTLIADLITETFGPWLNDRPLPGVIQGCNETCKVKLRGPALFPTTCSFHHTPMNPRVHFNKSAVLGTNIYMAPPLDHDGFLIQPNLVLDGRETINLVTGYSKSCLDGLHWSICTLDSGIGEYEAIVKNDKIMMDSLSAPTLVALANNTEVDYTWNDRQGGHPSTIGGVLQAVDTRWATVLFYMPNPSGTMSSLGISGQSWLSFLTVPPEGQACMSFRDPKDEIILSANKLMLYTGAAVTAKDGMPWIRTGLASRLDPGLSDMIRTTTTGYVQGSYNVYQTNYHYFLAAAIVELICIALVAPTYWGWWKLGRPVSFSPLETAKAFQCPMLTEFNSNSSGRDLAKVVDEYEVSYGVISVVMYADYVSTEAGGSNLRLAFAPSIFVGSPQKGSRFD